MMVTMMKCATLAVSSLFFLFNPVSVLAEDQAATDIQSGFVAPDNLATTDVASTNQAKPCKGQGGMMHGTGQHGKGGRGGAQHGKGGHGGGQYGKEGHDKHRQVVQRLDMIEARMAKIEAMLEILIRR